MSKTSLGYLVLSATLSGLVACSQSGSGDGNAVTAQAPPVSEDAIVARIAARMDEAFSQVWSEEQDASKFVMEYWTRDAVAMASDGPTAWSGHDELVPLIEEFMAAYPRITAEPVYTRVAGDTMAYQFAQFTFYPADPEGEPVPAKSLYVWLLRDGQWKIAADHFSYTLMDVPTIAKIAK